MGNEINDNMKYVAVGLGAIVLAFGALMVLQPKPHPQTKLPDDECGDVTDLSNVQHLSHHPQQYAACYKRIDPALFEQATGMRLEDFLRKNGIS